jgi:hypothetical protein
MKRFSLVSIAMLFAACDSGGPLVIPDVTMVSSANPSQYVANTLTVPLDRMQYGMDLNGDGKLDNQLGNIIGALSANNLNTQDGVDQSICKGQVFLLATVTSPDATHMSDMTGSGALIQVGKQFAYVDTTGDGKCGPGDVTPKYDGTDALTVDSNFSGAQFAGRISNGLFSSNSPVTTTHPVTVNLQLPLVQGADPVQLNIIGGHIQFRTMGAGLMSGQINGAIKAVDVQNKIIPNVAKLLNQRVIANPTGSTEKQILQIFDIGCDNATPGGTCNTTADCDASQTDVGNSCVSGKCTPAKMDGRIATCEVSGNSIIKNVLNPDVQMFDANGNYHPNPANTTRDSLSLGLGFTAVKATF